MRGAVFPSYLLSPQDSYPTLTRLAVLVVERRLQESPHTDRKDPLRGAGIGGGPASF